MNKSELDLNFRDITYPCFIHGLQGSGASLFTISLAAYQANQDKKILYFCAFPPGKEKLLEEVTGEKVHNIIIANPGDEQDFINILSKYAENIDYIIIKNFETYSKTTQQLVQKYSNIVISGDLDSLTSLDTLPATTIQFSQAKIGSIFGTIPTLENYTGYLVNKSTSGEIKLPSK